MASTKILLTKNLCTKFLQGKKFSEYGIQSTKTRLEQKKKTRNTTLGYICCVTLVHFMTRSNIGHKTTPATKHITHTKPRSQKMNVNPQILFPSSSSCRASLHSLEATTQCYNTYYFYNGCQGGEEKDEWRERTMRGRERGRREKETDSLHSSPSTW